MDPPTHGLLGAAIGQAFFARSLGSRAVAWGAVLNMLPDVDVVVIPLAGELAEWRYHRGVTHGLWFGPVVGAVLGWALWRWRGRSKGPEPAGPALWMALAIVSLLAHPMADAFTSYGTLLLWPSPRRFAWDALSIIDILFSAALLLAVLVGRLGRRGSRTAPAFAVGALAFCVVWEGYGLHLNDRAEDEARRQLQAAGRHAEVHAYPVLLQPWLGAWSRATPRPMASASVGSAPGGPHPSNGISFVRQPGARSRRPDAWKTCACSSGSPWGRRPPGSGRASPA